MARTLSEIYHAAKLKRDEYLGTSELQNDSKMSVMDAFTWTVSACIWTFENILDVFQTDIAKDINGRINGTPTYYANALLKYQSGDQLQMSEDGTTFSYPQVDESKRVITKVSYSEVSEPDYHDTKVVFKVATGEPGKFSRISGDELISVRNYLQQLSFAGMHLNVVSRKGDVLIPRVTVYYDGGVTEDELYGNIESALNTFIANADFNGVIYVQKIIDVIQSAEHVVDVYINTATDTQGIFIAQYNDDDELIVVDPEATGADMYELKVERSFVPGGGYVRESSGTGDEEDLQSWRSAMTFVIEQ